MGLRRKRHRIKKPARRLRQMVRPKGMESFNYVAVLFPTYAFGDEAQDRKRLLDMVQGWGPCRVRHKRSRLQVKTRIYFTTEAPLIMLATARREEIAKMFRLVEPTPDP